MPAQDNGASPAPGSDEDRELWRCATTAEAPEDEATRLLDLAAYADATLDDDDERARVAALLAGAPAAAADIAAAKVLAAAPPEVPSASVIARAAALVGGAGAGRGEIVPFTARRRYRPNFGVSVRWAGLAAVLLLTCWLGFDLGSDVSQAFGQPGRTSDDGVLRDLLDPATGFLRELTEGSQA